MGSLAMVDRSHIVHRNLDRTCIENMPLSWVYSLLIRFFNFLPDASNGLLYEWLISSDGLAYCQQWLGASNIFIVNIGES